MIASWIIFAFVVIALWRLASCRWMKRGVLALPSTAADSMVVDGMIGSVAKLHGTVEQLVDLKYEIGRGLGLS